MLSRRCEQQMNVGAVESNCAMRKVLLLYNPLSGSRLERRRKQVDEIVSLFRGAGVQASCSPTGSGPGTSEQARQAVASGFDCVFACGGDGTIHDVLQGLVGSQVALGVIPMGTANALAHDLRLPLSPLSAAQAAVLGTPLRVAVGKIECQGISGTPLSRYFIAALGIGVDAHLFYKLNPAMKTRLGIASYYLKAIHLWLTHRMVDFTVSYSGDKGTETADVSQLLGVRIRNFGGIVGQLARGASLESRCLRLVLFRTQSRIRYLRFVTGCLFRRNWTIPGIELADAVSLECRAPEASRIFVEADGELLGTLPARVSMLPDAVTLVVPNKTV